MPFDTATAEESYRSGSEDRVQIQDRGNELLIVVADGVGGSPGGGEAADLALRRILAHPKYSDERDLTALLATLDSELYEDAVAGETTIVVALVRDSGIIGASVGDSEALLVTPGGAIDLTVRQQRKPVLGSGVAVPMGFSHATRSGTLVMATDGLFKYTSQERISEQAREADLKVASKAILDLVRLKSGGLQDDIAIALCRWT